MVIGKKTNKMIVIALASIIILGFLLVGMILLQGFADVKTIPCASGQCIMTADGSKKLCPDKLNGIMLPNYKYSQCVEAMSCPQEGVKYAVNSDGSAITNTCDVRGCACSLYRRCPTYIGTIFRLFGAEKRISYFQVIDPIPNAFSPPYILNKNTDQCFLPASQIDLIYPALNVSDKCLRGVFAEVKSKPGVFACITDLHDIAHNQ